MKSTALNLDEIKSALNTAGVVFNKRHGLAKLTALAAEHGLDTTKARVSNSIVPEKFKKRYGKDHNCGDELASVMRDACNDKKGKCDERKLAEVMAQNSIAGDRWAGLNLGQQRMNLGNVLRNRLKNGEFVQVGEIKFNDGAAEDAEQAA